MFRPRSSKSRKSSERSSIMRNSLNAKTRIPIIDDKSSKTVLHKPNILPPGMELTKHHKQGTSKLPSKSALSQSYNHKPIIPNTIDDASFDDFLQKINTLPINEALESFFKGFFVAKNVLYWEYIPSLDILYCPSTNSFSNKLSGLVGYSFYSKSIISTANPPAHPSFHEPVDSKHLFLNSPALIIPLFDFKGEPIIVIEVVRPINGTVFEPDDTLAAQRFSDIFSNLSNFIIKKPEISELIPILFEPTNVTGFMKNTRPKIAKFFKSEIFEIWTYNREQKDMMKYSKTASAVSPSRSGIAGASLLEMQMINTQNSRLHNSYVEAYDGTGDFPAVFVPYTEDDVTVYSLVLRSPTEHDFFTNEIVDRFVKAAPSIVLAFKNSFKITDNEKELEGGRKEREGLNAIISAAQDISKELVGQKLYSAIMKRAIDITDSDRCSLFIVNETKDRLVSILSTGLDDSIDIPITRGIAGRTVKENSTMIIDDAYNNEYFDPSTDMETGYKTKTILSVPITNSTGEVIGVTQMINKKDGVYNDIDAKLVLLFNTFCGISIENARLYKESIDSSTKLKTIFEVSLSLSKTENLQIMLSDIMKNAKSIIGAKFAALWAYDEKDQVLRSLLQEGGKKNKTISVSTGFAGQCFTSNEGVISNGVISDSRYSPELAQMFGQDIESVLAVPIVSSKGATIGVCEMLNKADGGFTKYDVNLLQSFSTFASIALQNKRIKDISEHLPDIQKERFMTEIEATKYDTPKMLVLSDEAKARFISRDCFQPSFSEDDKLRELFYFFQRFDLLSKFKISAELLFRFLFTIRSVYNKVPYHNWTHAVDVTQYVVYELEQGKLVDVFTPFEKLAILVASICHDANHNGYNNVYNEKAELPLGILLKDQSVLEIYHCTVAINILSREEANIFASLNDEEVSKMWTIIINMIKATDMKVHFNIVKRASELLENGEFDINKPECRMLAMQLLLKAGDISNVSRPFEIADKWCDILNEEFFRQGDNEKKLGIGLTSPLNDRENSNKPKSQIGFYNFICLPLFNVIGKIFPDLQVNSDSISENLECWKSFLGQQPSNN